MDKILITGIIHFILPRTAMSMNGVNKEFFEAREVLIKNKNLPWSFNKVINNTFLIPIQFAKMCYYS
jgi:hypothetical protein